MSSSFQLQQALVLVLAQKLQAVLADQRQDGQVETIANTYLNYLAAEQQDLSQPLLRLRPVRADDWPVLEIYRDNFQATMEDIRLVFLWLKSLGDSNMALYNHLTSHYLGLKKDVRNLASQVNDLQLFLIDSAGGVSMSGDSFNTADKVDSLLSRDYSVARLDTDAGIITLPLDNTVYIPSVSEVKINAASNGIPGNNQQTGVLLSHADPSVAADGNLDTWFEYEIVSAAPISTGVLLDLTVVFQKTVLINQITLVLNNFGTLDWAQVEDILTSTDGKSFLSIKDDLFSPQGDEPFAINPSTSKYAGQGSYVFLPRNTKHLRLILQQNSAYQIDTNTGPRYRYAIGIREFTALGLTFQAQGELISQPFKFLNEIKKVSLQTTQKLPENLCSIEHYLSPDAGETWYPIEPLDGVSTVIPKVLSFNLQDVDSISTAEAVGQLRYRAVLNQLSGANVTQSLIQQYIRSFTETLVVDKNGQASLRQVPILSSVKAFIPLLGSCGLEKPVLLGSSDASANQDLQFTFDILSGSEEVRVNQQTWQRVGNFNSSDADSLVYTINYLTRTVSFGDGLKGKIPEANATISLILAAERVLLQDTTGVPVIKLQHPVDITKRALQIVWYEQERAVSRELLARGSTIFRLKHRHIVSGSFVPDTQTLSYLATEKTYVNGNRELTAAGHYSIDYRQGYVYSFSTSPANQNLYASYNYIPSNVLSSNDWTYLADSQDQVQLNTDAFHSFNILNEDLAAQEGQYLLTLSHDRLLEMTLSFTDIAGLTKELLYIDGLAEFSGTAMQQDESVPGDPGVQVFTLSKVPKQDYQVIFSDATVFKNEVASLAEVLNEGDYYISYSYGTVNTYSVTNGGSVSYYYHTNITDLEQSYSVDYYNGQVHLYNPLAADVKVSYQYCNYEVSYDFIQTISNEEYWIDLNNKQITITDSLVLASLAKNTNDQLTVQYNYISTEADNNSIVQKMITPVLSDYTLRLLTAAQLQEVQIA
jgi:hypothetical protein